jgi:HAD superfamily hydrolase (TIGR01490 family)
MSNRGLAPQRPYAVFDIDGTLIRWQLYHAIADAFARLGYMDSAAHQTIKSERLKWKRRLPGSSFRSYELQVIKTYEAALSKLNPKQVDQAIDLVFDEYKDQIYIFTRDLIKQLKQKDYMLLAISGSQTEIVKKIASHYGFDDYTGTVYEHKGGRYTGKVSVPSLDKDRALTDLVKKHNLPKSGSLAIGDSASDIAMLKLVEQPIAFNPERELYEHARQNGWKIVIERKNTVYELESHDGSYILA